jgi:hypothetical protein
VRRAKRRCDPVKTGYFNGVEKIMEKEERKARRAAVYL